MTALTSGLLVAAAIIGMFAARKGPSGAAGPVLAVASALLVSAAAIIALAAPAAQGFGLAVVRVAAVCAAMAGGSAVVTLAFRLAGADTAPAPLPPPNGETDQTHPGAEPEEHTAARPDADPDADDASPLRGGLAIGVLERAAIAVCVLANFSAGLAVIVAAKGLARYPELRNPAAAEQFIIGTFVSVLWATACAGVAVALGR